jgi:alkanesulfonate monooxygenase SsuD/methylene tetrahydromethanopterin reductase-like flavin-dependent oxidoreductase (luciferase family)
MRFALAPANWGPFGHPAESARLAALAERSGWDGYLTWDSLITREDPPPVYDPWVILAAVAMATETLRIGTCIAVVPRYKPHLLAMTLASLDALSSGRMILGVGLGDWTQPRSYQAFGETTDLEERAARLDEALEIITRLWAGTRVEHHGRHYLVDGFTLSGRPVQEPRIPIWVGGDKPGALRRAARWDGWVGPDNDPMASTPQDAMAVRRRLAEAGAGLGSFDIAWGGVTSPGDADLIEEYERAGVTWWVEILLGDSDSIRARVEAGPPTRR